MLTYQQGCVAFIFFISRSEDNNQQSVKKIEDCIFKTMSWSPRELWDKIHGIVWCQKGPSVSVKYDTLVSTVAQLTLLILEMEYSRFRVQNHACWCPGSWSRQSISRHGISYVGQTTCIDIPELISSTCAKPNPRYKYKCECIFYNL